MFNYSYYTTGVAHYYTFAVEGIKERDMTFMSRQAANNHMYDIISKYGLQLKEVWDDKHFKTYIFSNGVRIHINRE